MLRRDVLLAAGGFDRDFRYAEDLDAWLRVLEQGTGLLLAEVTCICNLHQAQISRDRPAMLASSDRVLERCAGQSWFSKSLREQDAVVVAWDDLQEARAGHDWAHAGRTAAWLAGRPARLVALGRLWSFRYRTRRRTREYLRERSGRPPSMDAVAT
jgi:hypothetical protein